jgi:cell division protein FtsB
MNPLFKFLWIILPLFILISTAIIVPLKLKDPNGYERNARLKEELKALKYQNRNLRKENIVLRHKIRAIQNDPDFIENIARNEMGMIAPDEVVYQF